MTKPTIAERSEQLQAAWRARGWPHDLLERARALHVRDSRLKRWAADDRWSAAKVRDALERQSRAPAGALRVRNTTREDNDALVDLYANSPSDQGEWAVTVERGPFAFAQFVLQDESELQVVEDRGELLATLAHAKTAMRADGIDTDVYIPVGWRVRNDVRGEGLGPRLQTNSYQRYAGKNVSMLYYRRRGSKKAQQAQMYLYPARETPVAAGVRDAVRSDVEACVALINGMFERSFDVHPVYDPTYLAEKLDGDTREARPAVYGWNDYYLLEEEGVILACAGLWDRGRHMRERWRHKSTGEERTIENTALIDFGYADGREDAMASLIGALIGMTARLGRSYLMAPLQFLPTVANQLANYQPEKETRAWYWNNNAMLRSIGFKPARPYMDLAYW
jgi:hypothetical protein